MELDFYFLTGGGTRFSSRTCRLERLGAENARRGGGGGVVVVVMESAVAGGGGGGGVIGGRSAGVRIGGHGVRMAVRMGRRNGQCG